MTTLNDKIILALAPGKHYFADAKAQGVRAPSGFGIRVTPNLCRSFFLRYTFAKQDRLHVIGKFPDCSVTDAIREARKLRQAIDRDEDPVAARQKAAEASANAFQAICESYYSHIKQRSSAWQKAQLKRLVYPVLGARDIASIRRSDIVRLMDDIARDNGPVMADRTLAVMSKIMTWHSRRTDDYSSPIVRGMSRTNRKERARDRILSDDELKAVWDAAGRNQGNPFGGYVRFILLTAARRDEARALTWDEIQDGIWTLPPERNKTKVELARPLSGAAIALLPAKRGKYVFSFGPGENPRGGGAIGKGSLYEMVEKLQAASGTADWTLHDLRRTARSLMSRADVPYDHAERCLGHVIGGVRETYDRWKYLPQMAKAYEALAGLVERIVNPAANVVALRA